ncbi:MAG: YebC/PmpR family DNA-binding transcriptional regulator [Elusimicrobia bacterium]|nr:YebC/PmpR family DNA-binding transcriptional regulator [Elusimicrobiota bacterium]
MSGHSKWAGIKHKKAAVDAKKGKIFSKLIREITVAAKEGGSDPEKNAKLRLVIQKAKQFNMPSDNIKRAIERSSKSAESYERVYYEGYGPGGVAVMVEAQTDNKNRTTSQIRRIFSSHGGNLGEVGCVGWMFKKKGYILVDKSSDEEKLMDTSISAGAQDIKDSEDGFEVFTDPENFEKVLEALKSGGFRILSSGVSNIPQTTVSLSGASAQSMLKLMEDLENNDDVVETSANFDISSEEMEKFASSM